jgi:hypothetical protein
MAGLIDKNKKMEYLITPNPIVIGSTNGNLMLRKATEGVRNNCPHFGVGV